MRNFNSDLYGPGYILRYWLSQQGFTVYLCETAQWGRQWMRKSQITFSEN